MDLYVTELVQLLQSFVKATVPISRPSKQATRWWNQDIRQAVTEERQAYRHWRATYSETSWETLTNATQVKRQLIANAKRDDWRQGVHEAATSPQGLWKLAKWARIKSHLPPELNKTPDLQTATGLARTTTEKAQAFQARFYPTTDPDLSDLPTTQEFSNLASDLLEPTWSVTSK